eukprot:TRINITY_DN61970_c0_g1_i1.p1 TRINITY_DN61970_c0_g1~~TRINITY_DN61970_c0_g1_i1.p1  ORF type:complete len:530 (+),score=72.99 TRINITY_DN61970_c0_g1_i1:62-1591(+)
MHKADCGGGVCYCLHRDFDCSSSRGSSRKAFRPRTLRATKSEPKLWRSNSDDLATTPDRPARGRSLGRRHYSPLREDQLEAGRLFVDSSRSRCLGGAEISYQRMWIPSVEEASAWAESLATVPSKGEAEVGHEVDLAVRFCMLSYSRNDAVAAQSRVFCSRATGAAEVLELQFHGTEDFEKGAHLVVYVYRLDARNSKAGVGVVMAYKGSTANLEDWRHNLRFVRPTETSASFGKQLFDDSCGGLLREAQCHVGFLDYKRTLDARMMQFSMASMQGLMKEWGAQSDAPHFLGWLRSGVWKWCAVVGHSLGGAMATIAATELAVKAGKATMLATLGAPVSGNAAFVQIQNEYVSPAGGLCITNRGDFVPKLGYQGVNMHRLRHGGRRVKLWGKVGHTISPYHAHLRYTIPSDCHESLHTDGDLLLGKAIPKMMTTFRFPGPSYKPSATADSLRFSLGSHFDVSSTRSLISAAKTIAESESEAITKVPGVLYVELRETVCENDHELLSVQL